VQRVPWVSDTAPALQTAAGEANATPHLHYPDNIPPQLTKRITPGWESSLINTVIISDVRTGL